MNLYTKLLCYLGLIKAPTLDIVQWIKDNPDCVVVDDWFFRTYAFIYKHKSFHVISWFDVQVDSVESVFNLFEEMLIHHAVRNINFNQDKGIPDNLRIRKELLE